MNLNLLMRVGFRKLLRYGRGNAPEGPRLSAIGASRPREHPLLKPEISVGSARDSDIVISDPTVSGRHAILERRFGRYRIIDLGSTNGTLVNGHPINSPTSLAVGDEVRFGGMRFVFLQSATARKSSKPIPPKAALISLALIFALGFMATQYFVNRSLSKRLTVTSASESAAVASLEKERDKSKELLAKERIEESQPLWLRRVNYYRRMEKLSPVTADPVLSHADFLHSRYLVEYELRAGSFPFAHTEVPNVPYYTPAGLRAARHSDIDERENSPISDVQAIDGWMSTPFHRLSILDPDALEAGMGSFTQDGFQALGLYLRIPPQSPHRFRRPVEFPPPNSTVPLALYAGSEWPNPLTSCPGYNAPTGLPVTLQLGVWLPVHVTAHSFSRDGNQLPSCVFDAATYVNPNAQTRSWARQGLRDNSAVILIPRAPLTSGQSYKVSITVSGQTYAWSFAVQR